ncbi:mitochondrial carrier domain-containing protein [Phascolomyces articulosus]|uniref:Mitochondrial glycine transporter n=1 Tax=Phascolomyces articulosus TaxID=60185 RepID=A0AAD5JXE9_9FUNG|nr:mitochondrial carrier domain-containing protein [Phascolomyces articulosus]
MTRQEHEQAVEKKRPQKIAHLVGGAMSGMTSCIMLQPLDLIKTRLQQSTHDASLLNTAKHLRKRHTMLTTIQDIIKTSGPVGLWRGTLPTIVRNVPGTAIYFTTLSEIRNVIAISRPTWQPVLSRVTGMPYKKQEKYENLIAGITARGAVGYILMPFTVLKVRYESNMYNYGSMLEAFRSVIKYDGVRGLFAGYGATFIRDAPFAGIYLFFYEHWKGMANGWKNQYDVPIANVAVNLGSGVMAGTTATCITQPFDMMKTRMQLDPHIYPNIWATTRRVFLEDGVKGFFDGLSLRLARKPLSSAISWAIYEEVVRFFSKRESLSQTTL